MVRRPRQPAPDIELPRMVVHVVWGSALAVAYLLGTPRAWLVALMALSLALLGALELLRRHYLKHPPASDDPAGLVARGYAQAARPFMRGRERKGEFVAALASVLGYLVVLALFDRQAAVAALLCASLGDPAARVAGVHAGSIRLVGRKTLQGTTALAAVCYVVCRMLGFDIPASAAAAAAVVLVDIASAWSFGDIPVEDNLLMPIAAAFALWAVG